jgi:hypothetical protein
MSESILSGKTAIHWCRITEVHIVQVSSLSKATHSYENVQSLKERYTADHWVTWQARAPTAGESRHKSILGEYFKWNADERLGYAGAREK